MRILLPLIDCPCSLDLCSWPNQAESTVTDQAVAQNGAWNSPRSTPSSHNPQHQATLATTVTRCSTLVASTSIRARQAPRYRCMHQNPQCHALRTASWHVANARMKAVFQRICTLHYARHSHIPIASASRMRATGCIGTLIVAHLLCQVASRIQLLPAAPVTTKVNPFQSTYPRSRRKQ